MPKPSMTNFSLSSPGSLVPLESAMRSTWRLCYCSSRSRRKVAVMAVALAAVVVVAAVVVGGVVVVVVTVVVVVVVVAADEDITFPTFDCPSV